MKCKCIKSSKWFTENKGVDFEYIVGVEYECDNSHSYFGDAYLVKNDKNEVEFSIDATMYKFFDHFKLL